MSNADLTAEIAEHGRCRCDECTDRDPLCAKCLDPWPCVVRRLADERDAIVTELEAVRALVSDLPETSVFIGFGQDRHCRFCGRTTWRGDTWVGPVHERACRWLKTRGARELHRSDEGKSDA